MSLTPEELERAKFPLVKHGYDPHAVEHFLAEVATNLRESDDFRRAGDEVAAALREFNGLLARMKQEAADEALRVRTEGEQEAFRVRTDAEQHSVLLGRQAEEESVRLRTEAEQEVSRLRAVAERQREELMTQAQSEVNSMLESAHAEREDAKRIAAAVEHTVAAKRSEFEEYLVAVTSLAESTARARVAAVLDGYRAEVERLVAAREQTSAALQAVRSSLEQAVSGLNADVDLTDGAVQEQPLEPPPLGDDAVEDAVTHALESMASPVDSSPGRPLP